MEDLLTKIADVLGMSVDGLLSSYPILRDQYASSYVINRFWGLVNGLGIILAAIALFLTISGLFLFVDGDGVSTIKTSVIVWILFLIAVLISIILGGMVVKVAPDLMFLKTLLQNTCQA